MTEERWKFLMDAKDEDAKLTTKEMADGWHWCGEFDGLLRQPKDAFDGEDGFECRCLKP